MYFAERVVHQALAVFQVRVHQRQGTLDVTCFQGLDHGVMAANRAAQVFYLNLSSSARELTLGFRATPRIALYNAARFHDEPTGSDPHAVIRC